MDRHQHRKADGSSLWVEVLLSPMTDQDGNVTHMIEAVRDPERTDSLRS